MLSPQTAYHLKGLSHPRRIRIYNILLRSKYTLNVGQIQAAAKLNNQAISHHLNQLERTGFIRKTLKGRETIITLKTTPQTQSAYQILEHSILEQLEMAA